MMSDHDEQYYVSGVHAKVTPLILGHDCLIAYVLDRRIVYSSMSWLVEDWSLSE